MFFGYLNNAYTKISMQCFVCHLLLKTHENLLSMGLHIFLQRGVFAKMHLFKQLFIDNYLVQFDSQWFMKSFEIFSTVTLQQVFTRLIYERLSKSDFYVDIHNRLMEMKLSQIVWYNISIAYWLRSVSLYWWYYIYALPTYI